MPEDSSVAKVRILRSKHGANDSEYDCYEVPLVEGMSVLGVLDHIYEHNDSSISYYQSCKVGRCTGCAVIVNGKPCLACMTLATRDMTIEPLRSHKVIKDLVVDNRAKTSRRSSTQP